MLLIQVILELILLHIIGDGNDGFDTATLTFTIIGADDDPVE